MGKKKSWLRKGLAALVLPALMLGLPQISDAQSKKGADKDDKIPMMKIKIFNNSSTYNIYPVLSTGTSSFDPWLQSVFEVPKSELKEKKFPKLNQFRIYINPTGDGIPPNESVTIKLPLYTQLVPTNKIDPTQTDQYIDWWGGARIEIFDAPAADGKPSDALTANYKDRDGQEVVKPIDTAEVPTCKRCQPFTIFKDPNGLKHNEPSQLTEYTLGALNLNKDPIELNDHNVDFDVSYVDDAYLPVAMEPFKNDQVGYVGMVNSIEDFRAALEKFTDTNSPYAGWPLYVDNQDEKILKIPSTLHIFGGDPDLTPMPWPPVQQLIDDWDDCVANANDSKFCKDIRAVREMFMENYKNYKKNYKNMNCNQDKEPVKLDEALMRQHVQGWGPFNEHCGANQNLLEQTPGYEKANSKKYQKIKDRFDDLQYLKSGKFNPYALLIHGEDYIGAPNVYAYSVDDAVGNMQADGKGLIIAVGGPKGLPNPEPATPPIHVSFGYSETDPVRFKKYGICTDTPNKKVDPDFASFDISITSIGKCTLSFIDNLDREYSFEIKSQPPYPNKNRLTPDTHEPIDCRANKESYNKTWCDNIFAYTLEDSKTRDNYVIAPSLPPEPGR